MSRDPRPDMEWNNHIASVEHPHLEVCSMFHTNDQDGNETGEANALLVAAAPDLLEALQEVFATLEPEIPGSPGSTLEKARAAIAKATVTRGSSEHA